ncbi:MAG: glucose 1-dehydrogenase [Nostoc sp.]|uniref:SDR family oxidoreductase n=1 Tax=Nostoc sp. TaxID=1180 RepID=UPI002FF60954
MSQKFTGKIALVTGGNSGIGLATAKQFVAEGAHVFITGRRQDGLDAAIKEIGENVTAVQGDVSNLADLDRLYATIKEQKGRLDILFANAGGGEFVPLEQITEEHFDKTFNINVKGVAFTVQKALPLLKDGSSIIMNASISASIGQPAFSIYAATKAAVRSFARTWSVDLKERHIRVNVVSPGIIPTPAHERLGITDEMYTAMLDGVPLGRVGTPDEVAKAVVFLASDDSSYITGIELFVDGGIAQI